ncbi:MAG: methionine adenosyltransferase domain-containing protein [Patescibacteria group bacterium]
MFKTAEAVTPMHPDKICDQISDAILDACLAQDPDSRVAIETMGGHNLVTITGELTTIAQIDASKIAREIVGDNYGIQTNIVRQSQEIAAGVDIGVAGDQGIMVGYACNENTAFIPQEIYLAKDLCRYLYNMHPVDGKTQITINDGKLESVVVSFCGVKKDELEKLVNNWLKNQEIEEIKNIYLNPAGDWSQGGFASDTGVTGRKLACDNYGPQIPIGGGAFSGKDATKVDRSGAYMARKIAVDLLKIYLAREVLVKIAYSIGVAEPVMVTAEITKLDNSKEDIQVSGYNLTPGGISDFLKLKRPQYQKLAEWGSFGGGFLWDK